MAGLTEGILGVSVHNVVKGEVDITFRMRGIVLSGVRIKEGTLLFNFIELELDKYDVT